MLFTDGYADQPRPGSRAELEEQVKRLKMQSWATPGDSDLREALEQAQAELAAYDTAQRRSAP
jgi:hypothetical protein